MKKFISNSYPYKILSMARGYINWSKTQFSAPSPPNIKQACLLRNGIDNATWIETGTYLGRTTEVLSKHAKMVFSIEPEPTLFANATDYFKTFSNVEVLNGVSETIFPELLPKIYGNINFWLDGHYSAGITFKGPQDTPILEELRSIAKNMGHFENIVVLVDDIRCFNPHLTEYSTYPPVDYLVDWARDHKLKWHIEHDIFVAKN